MRRNMWVCIISLIIVITGLIFAQTGKGPIRIDREWIRSLSNNLFSPGDTIVFDVPCIATFNQLSIKLIYKNASGLLSYFDFPSGKTIVLSSEKDINTAVWEQDGKVVFYNTTIYSEGDMGGFSSELWMIKMTSTLYKPIKIGSGAIVGIVEKTGYLIVNSPQMQRGMEIDWYYAYDKSGNKFEPPGYNDISMAEKAGGAYTKKYVGFNDVSDLTNQGEIRKFGIKCVEKNNEIFLLIGEKEIKVGNGSMPSIWAGYEN